MQKALEIFVPPGSQNILVSDLPELLNSLEIGGVEDEMAQGQTIEAAILHHIEKQRNGIMRLGSQQGTTPDRDISVSKTDPPTRAIRKRPSPSPNPIDDLSFLLGSTTSLSTSYKLTTPPYSNGVYSPAGRNLIPLQSQSVSQPSVVDDPFDGSKSFGTRMLSNPSSEAMRNSVPTICRSTIEDLHTLDAGLFQSSDLVGLDTSTSFLCPTGATTQPSSNPGTSSANSMTPDITNPFTEPELFSEKKSNNSAFALDRYALPPKAPPTVAVNELATALEELKLIGDDKKDQRYFVLLSLEEAESIRAALHVAVHRGSLSVIPEGRVAIALRHVASKFALLDSSHHFNVEKQRLVMIHGVRQQTALSCYRFLNSEIHFSERQVALLIRALQGNDCNSRKVSKGRDQGGYLKYDNPN